MTGTPTAVIANSSDSFSNGYLGIPCHYRFFLQDTRLIVKAIKIVGHNLFISDGFANINERSRINATCLQG